MLLDRRPREEVKKKKKKKKKKNISIGEENSRFSSILSKISKARLWSRLSITVNCPATNKFLSPPPPLNFQSLLIKLLISPIYRV